MTHRLDDGGVRRRGARDGGDDARRGGRHHNLYARENTRARARVVSHAFAFAFAFARPRARPAPAESSSRRVVTHRVLSIHIRHPIPSDPWMHRARVRCSRRRSRVRARGYRRTSSSRVVSSPPRRRRATVVRGRRPRPRASPRVPRDERTHERRKTTTTIERSIERARPAGHYFSPRIHAAFDASLASARAPSRHPSIHPSMRARAIGPTLAPDRIEIARTFCSLVVSAARATTTRPVRRLEFAVALTARVSRACVIARVVANIVGVCRPRARATGGRDGARWVGARDVMSMGSEACTLCGCVSCVCVMVFRGV